MLPRHHRLTHSGQFSAVLRRGTSRRRRAGTAHLVLVRRDSSEAHPPRVGFVVSKAVGNSVTRHRVVRRLRALAASRVPALPTGTDVVVRATPAAATASWAELTQSFDAALRKVEP